MEQLAPHVELIEVSDAEQRQEQKQQGKMSVASSKQKKSGQKKKQQQDENQDGEGEGEEEEDDDEWIMSWTISGESTKVNGDGKQGCVARELLLESMLEHQMESL